MNARTEPRDRISPDHYPECPKCHDICGRLARVCASCGTALFDPRDAVGVESPVMNAAPKREDSPATRERGV